MNRQRYLREASEALREAECLRRQRRQARLAALGAAPDGPGARALDRLACALRVEGLAYDGGRWQCPSCRSQRRRPEFVLEMHVEGKHVELCCARGCRPNTIRALLGAPPYYPTLTPRPAARFPYR